MRGASLLWLFLAGACAREDASKVSVPGREGRLKSTAASRSERRLFDGAPPVIPHPPMGAACTNCHATGGVEVPGVGFAPPSPHEMTSGVGAVARCEQCHVFVATAENFVANAFVGLAQDMRPGDRLNALAPPTLPHRVFMRENCLACHTGPAAREEIRCTHPERVRCLQCHVPQVDVAAFERL